MTHVLGGSVRLSEPGVRRTAGMFSKLILDNRDVFRRYFGVELYPGSLNVDVQIPGIHTRLDTGRPTPAFVIPRNELVGMPGYLGNGQAWHCDLVVEESGRQLGLWLFRRIGSRVPQTVLELLSPLKLVDELALKHQTRVTLTIHSGKQ